MSRSYDQYCPVARALELVGERWTLLVARELLLGPRRFTDLMAGLPGISANVLAGRLSIRKITFRNRFILINEAVIRGYNHVAHVGACELFHQAY